MAERGFHNALVLDREDLVNTDSVLPGQLSPTRHSYKTAPERALIAAVLERAVADSLGPTRLRGAAASQGKGTAREIWDARRWFESDADCVMSFVWICDAMGLEPSRVRAWIESKRGPLLNLVQSSNGARREFSLPFAEI